jgi:phage tail-like protein
MANYPLTNFQFIVEWGGTNIGFSEIAGLTMSNDVVEYRDGTTLIPGTTKMPGLRKFDNIMLKRGVVKGDNDFYNWINTISLNTVERRDITISLLDAERNPVVRWTVRQAWPCRLSYAHLKSGESHVMMEELEIAHEGWSVANNS